MRWGSLKFRLTLAATLSLALALSLAGFGLTILFERHVERRVVRELSNHLRQLVGALDIAPDGTLSLVAPLADQRFAQPLSGLYWQVAERGKTPSLRSRSLWDEVLTLEEPPGHPARGHVHRLEGPKGAPLLALVRAISVKRGERRIRLLLAVATERSEVTKATRDFARELVLSLGLLGFVLVLASWAGLRLGLEPLEAVRRRLAGVREGTARRMEGRFPEEVTPLVEEVNLLLDAQERSIERARERAGNLAHGLKTPLTALRAIGRALDERGQDDIAREIEAHITAMHAHVERELTRARMAAGHGVRRHGELAPAVRRLVDVMAKLPRGDALSWEVCIEDGLTAAIEAHDLTEILGNLLDNARKWARRRVRILGQAEAATGRVHLCVEDDGPGVAEEDRARVLERGRRLDENSPGTGLGLAIAKAVVAECHGTLELYAAPLGGLGVRITLPRAHAGPAGRNDA